MPLSSLVRIVGLPLFSLLFHLLLSTYFYSFYSCISSPVHLFFFKPHFPLSFGWVLVPISSNSPHSIPTSFNLFSDRTLSKPHFASLVPHSSSDHILHSPFVGLKCLSIPIHLTQSLLLPSIPFIPFLCKPHFLSLTHSFLFKPQSPLSIGRI